ncbi:MAG: ComEC/Rec2 family competence protein [Qipengyuania sp.]
MSSIADAMERHLAAAGFDRGPWLAVGLAAGIGAWFWLTGPWQWLAALVACLLIVLAARELWKGREGRFQLMLATVSMALVVAAGLALVWTRSEVVGARAIDYPRVERLDARILERQERPAEDRIRLVLAARDPENARAVKLRINVPTEKDLANLKEGALIQLRARLMPPAAPILPGGYDFARTAWFDGLVATGTLIGEIEVLETASRDDLVAKAQRSLSAHVRSRLSGSEGSIAATLASGDRGAITEDDEAAMRDAGLTHLLSISGLHVSAVIAAAYMLALKLLALWPWLTLRVRLPLVAAAIAALAGISYTLLTGAQVPTVRSCVGAVLVLLALALGREPLSMRMVAVAAIVVLALWPESLMGPSFQMSFAAVIAIIALHSTHWARDFLAPRDESWARKTGRRIAILFLTGLLIEFALMPIVLFHFHRAGVYGAFANVLAIPLVTFISMPLIALALFLDLVGLGGPAWWLAGKSLQVLIALARFTAALPGSVKLMPQMGLGTLLLFVSGALWLALWRGRARLAGLGPIAIGAVALAFTPVPDVLITRDGRHVGVTGEDDRLLVLRDSRSSYARDNLREMAGAEGELVRLAAWPDARCSGEFCVLTLARGGRDWHLLMSRSSELVEERALAAACAQSDIVVSDRFLPRSCKPRWLRADRRFLEREGGLALYLDQPRLVSVRQSQGTHGWWRGSEE